MIRSALDLIRKHIPPAATPQPTLPISSPAPVAHARKSWLEALPPILAVSFLISFFWDHEALIRILSVSGLIGFGTNWLAITMLFRPRHKRPLLGHGLIPAQKERIVEKLSQAVVQNLINPEAIRAKLVTSGVFAEYLGRITEQTRAIVQQDAFRIDLNEFILQQIRDVVADEDFRKDIAAGLMEHVEESVSDSSLERMAFSVYKKTRTDHWNKIVDKALLNLPELVEPHLVKVHDWLDSLPDEVSTQFAEVEKRLIDSVYDIMMRLDLKSLMANNLRNYDEGRLESLIKDATLDQLRYIQYLGAILGTIGGFLIWNPVVALPVMLVILAVVWASDVAISRWTD